MSPGTRGAPIFGVAVLALLWVAAWLGRRTSVKLSKSWQYGLMGAALVVAEVIAAALGGVPLRVAAITVAIIAVGLIYSYRNTRECPTCRAAYMPQVARDWGKPFCPGCGTRLVPQDAKKSTADPLD